MTPDESTIAKRLKTYAEAYAQQRGVNFTDDGKVELANTIARMATDIARETEPAKSLLEAQANLAIGRFLARAASRRLAAGFTKPTIDAEDVQDRLAWPIGETGMGITREVRGIEGLKLAAAVMAQFATLAAALLTFTLTFAGFYRPSATQPAISNVPLVSAWVCLALALVFALFAVLNTVTMLDTYDRLKEYKPSIGERRLAMPAIAAVGLFALAIGLIAFAMHGALPNFPYSPPPTGRS